MSIIYMVRHGQASFGKPEYDVLSETGFRQAKVLGDYLMKIGMTFDAVYSGELARQRDTALTVLAAYRERGIVLPEPRILSEFNEYDAGSVFSTYVSEIAQEDPVMREDLKKIYTDRRAFERVFEKVIRRWVSGNHLRPGMPVWEDFKAKVAGGIRHVMAENGRKKKIIIFSSGGTISAVANMALGIPNEQTMRLAAMVANTAVTTFLYNDDRFSMSSFNSIAHLALENGGGLVTHR
jgi:broad specificity phosphatase PhoE